MLGQLIKALENVSPDKVVRWGFSSPHSYRGYYEQLAFTPAENVTVASMLAHARSALGATFTGWKGGEYTMDEHVECWIAGKGECSDDMIGPILLKYMLGD